MTFVAILGLCCAGLALACIVVRIGCRGWTRATPESADTLGGDQ